MDFNVFMKRLEEKLNSVLMPVDKDGELSLVGCGYNSGARTMYNLALAVAMEVITDGRKGGGLNVS